MFCECWLTGNRCETNDNTIRWPTLPAAWCSLGCLAVISNWVHVTCVQQVGAQKKEPVFQIRYKINIGFLLLRHNQGYFVWEFEGKCMFWGRSTILNMKSMKQKRNLSQFEHHIYILTFLPFNVNCSLQHIWLSLNYYEPKAIFIVVCFQTLPHMNHSWLETLSFCHFQQILLRHQNVPSLCGHPKTVWRRLVKLRKNTLNLFDALDYLLMCWITMTMSLYSCLYSAGENMFVFAKKLFL